MSTGWHVTTTSNRAKILEQGLRRNVDGWDSGYVWFFVDRDVAEQAALTGSWGGSRGANDIWEINLASMEVLPDPHPGWGSLCPGWDAASRVTTGDIPTSALALL